MPKKIIALIIPVILVFLILPGRVLAGEPEKPYIENIASDYFFDVERQMRHSGFDIKHADDYFYVNPELISPKEISDYHNSWRDTRVPADFEKILINAGIHSGYRVYNNSAFSKNVNQQLATLKKSLENKGLGFIGKMINPEIKLHTGDDPFFAHGYLLEKPITTEISIGSQKNGLQFGWKMRGLDWPKPKIETRVYPFKIEAEYSISKKEAKLKLTEVTKTNLQIEYKTKSGNLSKGRLKSTAAIVKIPGTKGKIFFSGHYDFNSRDASIWAIYIVRF